MGKIIAKSVLLLLFGSFLIASAAGQRIVLMPVKGEGLSALELSACRAAIVEGLGKKYEVSTGTEVDSVIQYVVAASIDCDTLECVDDVVVDMDCATLECRQDVALTFQTELVTSTTVLQKAGQYLLRVEVINVFDEKVVYSKSESCEKGQVLYGKLLLEGPSGTSPFGGANVILAAAETPDSTFKAHTDQKGFYAFYGVPPGKYKLRVEIGGNTMEQVSGDFSVEVTKQPMNNNSITVKQKN